MGKAKKPKIRRSFRPYDDIKKSSTSFNSNSVSNDMMRDESEYPEQLLSPTRNISYQSDLHSTDESTICKALRILGNLVAINITNSAIMKTLLKPDVFLLLRNKLANSTNRVLLEVILVLKNITSSDDNDVHSRIIEANIFDILLTKFMDKNNFSSIEGLDRLEGISFCICNMASHSDSNLNRILDIPNFLETVYSILFQTNMRLTLKLVVSNLILIITDFNELACSKLASTNSIDKLFELASGSDQLSRDSNINGNIFEYRLFYLRCCGIIVNIYCSLFENVEISKLCRIQEVLSILFHYLEPDISNVNSVVDLLKASDVQFLHETDNDILEDEEIQQNFQQPKTNLRSAVVQINSLDVTKLASELIANIFAQLSDDVDVDDADDMDDDEMEIDDAISEDESVSCVDVSINASKNSSLQVQSLSFLLTNFQVADRLANVISMISHPLLKIVKEISIDIPITSSFILILEVVDTIVMTATNVLLANLETPQSNESIVLVFMDLLDFMYDAVANTLKSKDSEGNELPLWPVHSSVDRMQLVRCITATASSTSEAIREICGRLKLSPEYSRKLALLLVKGVTSPVMEIALPCLEAIALVPLESINVDIFSIYTNCTIRRMMNPACISIQDSSSTICFLYIIDTAIMTLIDLHSSDNLDYFDVFQRLGSKIQLQSSLEILKTKVKEQASQFSKANIGRFKDTISNGKRFLKYKDDFAKSILK